MKILLIINLDSAVFGRLFLGPMCAPGTLGLGEERSHKTPVFIPLLFHHDLRMGRSEVF